MGPWDARGVSDWPKLSVMGTDGEAVYGLVSTGAWVLETGRMEVLSVWLVPFELFPNSEVFSPSSFYLETSGATAGMSGEISWVRSKASTG